ISGRRSVRTATLCVASPTLTVFDSLFFEKSSLRACPRASGSATSPSRKTPGLSGARPNLVTVVSPFDATSAAATLPASTSRPTTALLLVVESILSGSKARGRYTHSIDRRGRSLERPARGVGHARPAGDEGPTRDAQRVASALEEAPQVPVEDRVAEPQGRDAAEGEEGAERERLLSRRDAAPRDHDETDRGSGCESDQHRRGNRAAQVEAHDCDQLHIAHSHAAWICERDAEEEATPSRRRDAAVDEAGGIGEGGDRDGDPRPGEQHRVGDHAPLEISEGHDHQQRT